ncbi:methylated-DNA--[protein]-cysteine S-methyltransferase [Flavimaricola marinus]|uniref:methylated-DNA--[protein]-cysteine S-methyltransferase n=1 Tax=Flavimaricola marinus TaxID=1819565 RepID=A0A238LCH4_9RHOB|nr:methylated-DNA--[protein]-cysteine S-methyltransferase [Flavimaricola marinus]SMY06630.1 Methylated-DNA--protein-cysteine methyltransferase [Flavimaricola marinus]
MRNAFTYESPVGPLAVRTEDGAVLSLTWGRAGPPLTGPVANWLDAYFEGRPTGLPPLVPMPTEFQMRFRDALIAIPFGETRTYGDLAKSLGVSAQAIGQACGANPIPIIVPCHRVLGANGLGGFSGGSGVEAKVALLRHEGAASLLI